MILDSLTISRGITERLEQFELTDAIASALDKIMKITNNPFFSDIYETNVIGKFSKINQINQGEELDPGFELPTCTSPSYDEKCGDAPLTLYLENVNEDLVQGMVIYITGASFLDGIHIIREIQTGKDGFIILETKSVLGGRTIEKNINFYALKLPKGIDNIITSLIDMIRIDLADLAGVRITTQGSDTQSYKDGSKITHYITNAFPGYYRQPNRMLELFRNKKD